VAGKKRGNFFPEFKEEAARMVVETSRSIAEVARELGLNGATSQFGHLAVATVRVIDAPCNPSPTTRRLRRTESELSHRRPCLDHEAE
jgi:transposase